VRHVWLIAAVLAVGCAGGGTAVPSAGDATVRAPERAEAPRVFCAAELTAPEPLQIVLTANDVKGVDCVPPDGAEKFSLGFAHDGWWLQLDIARPTIVMGRAHPFDGQAALLALDCWEWSGAVTVDEDDAAGWALALDVTCVGDTHKRIAGSFRGAR